NLRRSDRENVTDEVPFPAPGEDSSVDGWRLERRKCIRFSPSTLPPPTLHLFNPARRSARLSLRSGTGVTLASPELVEGTPPHPITHSACPLLCRSPDSREQTLPFSSRSYLTPRWGPVEPTAQARKYPSIDCRRHSSEYIAAWECLAVPAIKSHYLLAGMKVFPHLSPYDRT